MARPSPAALGRRGHAAWLCGEALRFGMVPWPVTVRSDQSWHGGVYLNEEEPPHHSDFAYLTFTVGMTFQVSDTDHQTKELRATALRQALLPYVMGTGITAAMINLVAGLGK